MSIRILLRSLITIFILSVSFYMEAEIDETIVAASLFPIGINDSANSINVISAEDIENTPHLNLADLLRDLPGISVSQSGVASSMPGTLLSLFSNGFAINLDASFGEAPSRKTETLTSGSWILGSAATGMIVRE